MKRFYLMLLALIAFSSSVLVGTASAASTDPIVINGHKFVDLGLPSGLLWAETNVGASSADEDGNYFAWGETASKSDYMPYYYDSSSIIDAATANWGGICRTPKPSEFEELYSQCDWMWKSNYQGASGYVVTGPNGNSLFLPASGYRYHTNKANHGSLGLYASSSYSSQSDAYYLTFSSESVSPSSINLRYQGCTVRAVAENKNKSDASDGTDNNNNQTFTYNSYLKTDIQCGMGSVNNRMAYVVWFNIYNNGSQDINVTKCVVRTPDGDIFTTANQSILGVVKAGDKGGFINYSYYTSQFLRFDYHTQWYYTLDGVEYVFDSEKEYPTNISNVEEKTNVREVQRYDVSGRVISSPQKGINIIRYSDGTTMKVIIK